MSPNPFDQASRYLAKLDPIAFLRWLLPLLATTVRFRGWLDTRTVPFPGEPDRTCDTVAGLVDETTPEVPWALPVEFQTRPCGDMFGRLLEYVARLWRELRPPDQPEIRYQVVAALVNLTGVGHTSRTMELGQTGLRTCLQVVERNLSAEDGTALLAEIAAGGIGRCILPFLPLMRGGMDADNIAHWKRLASAEPDSKRRADYGGLALVFAELTEGRSAWQQALEDWNVEQSQQVLEWQAEGKADWLLRLLERRFATQVPPEVASAILATKDVAQLDNWFEAALSTESLDEFRRLAQLQSALAMAAGHR